MQCAEVNDINKNDEEWSCFGVGMIPPLLKQARSIDLFQAESSVTSRRLL